MSKELEILSDVWNFTEELLSGGGTIDLDEAPWEDPAERERFMSLRAQVLNCLTDPGEEEPDGEDDE